MLPKFLRPVTPGVTVGRRLNGEPPCSGRCLRRAGAWARWGAAEGVPGLALLAECFWDLVPGRFLARPAVLGVGSMRGVRLTGGVTVLELLRTL